MPITDTTMDNYKSAEPHGHVQVPEAAKTMKLHVVPESGEDKPSKPRKFVVRRYKLGKIKTPVSADNSKPAQSVDEAQVAAVQDPEKTAGRVVAADWKLVAAAEWEPTTKQVVVRYHKVNNARREDVTNNPDLGNFPLMPGFDHSCSSSASISSIMKSITHTTLTTIEEDPDQEDLIAMTSTAVITFQEDPVHKDAVCQDPVYDKSVHDNRLQKDPVHKARIDEPPRNSICEQDHANNTTNQRCNDRDEVDEASISAFGLMEQYDLDPETFTDDQLDEIMWYQARYVRNQRTKKKRASFQRHAKEIFADADGDADK